MTDTAPHESQKVLHRAGMPLKKRRASVLCRVFTCPNCSGVVYRSFAVEVPKSIESLERLKSICLETIEECDRSGTSLDGTKFAIMLIYPLDYTVQMTIIGV